MTELAYRLSIAEASYFSDVTYASAEKMICAVHKGKPPGEFWVQIARIIENARFKASSSLLQDRVPEEQAPEELSLHDSIDLWKAKGYVLLGYVWMNPKTADVNYSFNPESPIELRKKYADKLGIPFEERSLLNDFKKQ